MSEDECGAGDVADFAGAGGDVLEDAPAAFEQGEPAFAEAAQAAVEAVVGAVVDAEGLAVGGVLDGCEDADSGAFVAAVGQGGKSLGRCGVQGAQDVGACCGQVVDRAGFDIGGPQREPGGGREGLDVAGVLMGLAGVPQIDLFALTLMVCSAHRSVGSSVPSVIR